MKLGFVGTGAITSAIVTGLSSAGDLNHSIFVSPRNPAIAADLASRFPEVSVAFSNQAVLDESDTIVIAVRPQIAESALSELRFRATHNVISLASGFSVSRIASLVKPASKITRAIPLPSTAKRRCPTAIFPHDSLTVDVFAPLGAAFEVETEREFDALATATATMAAYFTFEDTIVSWLARQGIPQAKARDYMSRIFSGLSATAMEMPGQSLQSLASDHATRGGTNEQIVTDLKKHGVFDSLSQALDSVMRRVTSFSPT